MNWIPTKAKMGAVNQGNSYICHKSGYHCPQPLPTQGDHLDGQGEEVVLSASGLMQHRPREQLESSYNVGGSVY